MDFPSAQSEREQESGEARLKAWRRRKRRDAEEELRSLWAQMISMWGPRLGSGPQRWRSGELADDGVAQMGSSVVPRSLLCMDPAL